MREDDISEVMAEERNRGRRQPKPGAARKERLRKLQTIRSLLSLQDERTFTDSIRALGLKEGSPEFRDALHAWRESRKP